MGLQTFSIVELTDKHFTRQQISLPRQFHFRPSEASTVWIDANGEKRVAGTCLRQVYFRATGLVPAGTRDAYTQWIFRLGKAVEEVLVNDWKEMGIWVANNVEFYWDKYNVKGEIDCIIAEPGTNRLIPCEIKSFAGYNAGKEIIGNKSQQGKPKTSQMLQALVYLYAFQDKFPYIKMVYYSRDMADRTEYDITLVSEGSNKTRAAINGVIDSRFYIENILARYTEAEQWIQMNNIPPPDYEYIWDAEKVERRYALGEVGKTKYEKWQKGKEIIGSWQCSPIYCPFHSVCWAK